MGLKINDISLFSGMNQEQLESFKQFVYKKQFPEDKVLFLEGEKADAIYIILQGEVQIIKTSPEGKEKILKILVAGDFFGEMGVIEAEKRSAMAKTSRETTLLRLGKEQFLKYIKQNPEIAFNIIIELSHRLRLANKDIENLAFKEVEDRLKELLCRLADKSGADMVIRRKMTHRELAKLAGTSRETVTRIFSKWRQNNLIEDKGNKIYLINPSQW